MIIELFGPPAAGKTTLARALATALESNGCGVELVVSSRPAEQAPAGGKTNACRNLLAAPLIRASKLVGAVRLLLARPNDSITANMLELLPPRSISWSIRYRRYLLRLSRAWEVASASDRIFIFDQAFVSAISSLSLLTRKADRNLARGLELIPRPDVLIRLDAPKEVLERRLRERLGRQGAGERLFELSLDENLQQIEIAAKLDNILHEQGWPVTLISYHRQCVLQEVVATLALRIRTAAEQNRRHMDLLTLTPPAAHQSYPTMQSSGR